MKPLRFIAFISILIMMAVLCIWSITAIGIERTVLSASYYREILVERKVVENIRRDVIENLPDTLMKNIEEKKGPLNKSETRAYAMITQAVQNATSSAFDTPWLESEMMKTVPGIVKYLRGRNKGIYLVIHLGGRVETFERVTAAEFEKIDEKYLKLAGMKDGDTEKFAQDIIDEMDIPDSIDIGTLLEETILKTTNREIGTLTVWRRLSYFAPYGLAIVFCMILCLMYGKGGGILRTGIAFTVSSIATIIALTSTRGKLPGLIVENASSTPDPYIVEHAIKPIVDATIQRAVVTPIIISITGIMLIAAGSLIIIHNKHIAENVHHTR